MNVMNSGMFLMMIVLIFTKNWLLSYKDILPPKKLLNLAIYMLQYIKQSHIAVMLALADI